MRSVYYQDDKRVLNLWENEMTFEGGHYTLPIPWKTGTPGLPENRFVAERRLNNLNHKLSSQGLTDKYQANIDKFLSENYAEPVPETELTLSDGSVWYLPHHPVISSKKPGKIRTVFDCAAKLGDIFLNNQCFQGPDLNDKFK